ncbi:unnamed protein product [Urochloa humidicola]
MPACRKLHAATLDASREAGIGGAAGAPPSPSSLRSHQPPLGLILPRAAGPHLDLPFFLFFIRPWQPKPSRDRSPTKFAGHTAPPADSAHPRNPNLSSTILDQAFVAAKLLPAGNRGSRGRICHRCPLELRSARRQLASTLLPLALQVNLCACFAWRAGAVDAPLHCFFSAHRLDAGILRVGRLLQAPAGLLAFSCETWQEDAGSSSQVGGLLQGEQFLAVGRWVTRLSWRRLQRGPLASLVVHHLIGLQLKLCHAKIVVMSN